MTMPWHCCKEDMFSALVPLRVLTLLASFMLLALLTAAGLGAETEEPVAVVFVVTVE